MSKIETAESIEAKVEKIEVTGEADRIRKIEKRIIDEAEDKAKTIAKEAEKTKKEILEVKRKEGGLEAEKITRGGTNEADSLKRQKTAEARLKAKQMIIASREDLINETIEKSKGKLHGLTESEEYGGILGKLIEEGATSLGGGELVVIFAGKGSKTATDLGTIAKRVEKLTGNKTTINVGQENLKSIGGVVIRKADGSVIVDNTFEARIDRIIRDIRIRAAKILFG